MQTDLQLSTDELSMAQEVFAIMSKYSGRIRQFGIQLVHEHFPVSSDEILYETHDIVSRTLNVRPVAMNSFAKMPLATSWHQTEKGKIAVSMVCCDLPVETPPPDFPS